jgi:hypothetical protein
VDGKVWMYLAYLAISIGLTVWVARTLSRNGLVFLEDVFSDARLAKAVNHLLVVGFYLLNLGYVTVAMRYGGDIATVSHALEELSLKIGLVLLVLGALHFFNVFALNRYRRSRLRQHAPYPPLAPAGRLPMPPGQIPPMRPTPPGHPMPPTTTTASGHPMPPTTATAPGRPVPPTTATPTGRSDPQDPRGPADPRGLP